MRYIFCRQATLNKDQVAEAAVDGKKVEKSWAEKVTAALEEYEATETEENKMEGRTRRWVSHRLTVA
jgi:hypothetical protein